MNTRSFLPFALLAVAALSGCQKEEATPTETSLLAHRWMLQRVGDFPIALSSYSETQRSYLEFVDLGSCTVGLGPCNNFSGRYTLSSQQLTISPQISTRATCPAQDIETRYLTSLSQTTRYEISGNELRLYGSELETPLLVFRQEAR